MATYSTDAMVKERLGITTSDFDTQIGTKREQAHNWINNELDPFTTVPLSSVPDMIKEIEADIAAGMFREERDEPTVEGTLKRSLLRARGEEALERYIVTNYKESKRAPPTIGFTKILSANTWEG